MKTKKAQYQCIKRALLYTSAYKLHGDLPAERRYEKAKFPVFMWGTTTEKSLYTSLDFD